MYGCIEVRNGRIVNRLTAPEAEALFAERRAMGMTGLAPRSAKPRINIREMVAALQAGS